MQFHKSGDIIFCSAEPADLDYVGAVAKRVYADYRNDGPHWQLPPSDETWEISFGGRAGVLGVRLEGRVSCAKLFYDERMRTKLRVAAGFSKGRRAYRHGVRLEKLGVNCPKMLGYAERRPTGPALIVTDLADDAERLDLWVPQHGAPRQAVTALAQFIRHLHDSGASHADLSPRNILIRKSSDTFEFLLLDYEDARFARQISRHRRLEDLHHLHERMVGYVPLRDRLRFLRTYAPQDYRTFRDPLRRTMEKSDFQWLRSHDGPNTTSIPSQGRR